MRGTGKPETEGFLTSRTAFGMTVFFVGRFVDGWTPKKNPHP
jgi:hypothetical protein